MNAPRYIMIGGFLGAGKSTAIGRFARHLDEQGKRVGLITNDQGEGLVDTRRLTSQGFDVEEIAGGCFCCRFDSLKSAADRLTAGSRPDVFLAEPVGSCTDLLATVSYPLRRIYGDSYRIAPLSVVVDPLRAARVLGFELPASSGSRRRGRGFSSKVVYVYLKQLEEAQVIVLNKIDLLDEGSRTVLRAALEDRFPGRPIFEVSARDGDGLAAWFEHVTAAAPAAGQPLDIDYRAYGEGEALLGWLNATLRITAAPEIDGNSWLRELAAALQTRLVERGARIAHLKMTLSPAGAFRELGLINLVDEALVPEMGEALPSPITAGELVVNLRAEAPPEDLRAALEAELAERVENRSVRLALEHLESFRPGQPRPTHRLTSWNEPVGASP